MPWSQNSSRGPSREAAGEGPRVSNCLRIHFSPNTISSFSSRGLLSYLKSETCRGAAPLGQPLELSEAFATVRSKLDLPAVKIVRHGSHFIQPIIVGNIHLPTACRSSCGKAISNDPKALRGPYVLGACFLCLWFDSSLIQCSAPGSSLRNQVPLSN